MADRGIVALQIYDNATQTEQAPLHTQFRHAQTEISGAGVKTSLGQIQITRPRPIGVRGILINLRNFRTFFI